MLSKKCFQFLKVVCLVCFAPFFLSFNFFCPFALVLLENIFILNNKQHNLEIWRGSSIQIPSLYCVFNIEQFNFMRLFTNFRWEVWNHSHALNMRKCVFFFSFLIQLFSFGTLQQTHPNYELNSIRVTKSMNTNIFVWYTNILPKNLNTAIS